MTFPVFASGDVLNASDMNAVGLWLVKTQTVGTGVSSVTVNNAFSADYDNYKIIWSGGQSSAAAEIYMQLTTGGTASTASYYGALAWVSLTTAAVSGASDNNAARWSWAGAGAGANDGAASLNVDLLGPYLAKRTRLHNAQVVYATVYGTYTGLHDLGNSYDGFKLTPYSGTISGGTIRVYGYRN
jgi:hypothetical protein